MKRKILIYTLLSLITCALSAQVVTDRKNVPDKKTVWDYPVKPGMKEWSQFESLDGMYKSCQIPELVLEQLDTESLVDICLNFPAPPLFPLFNTPQEGFLSHYSSFNGIRELLNRKEAGHYLLKKYAAMTLSDFNPLWPLHKQGQFISHYKFVETILSQPQILQSLETKERKLLLKEALLKFDEKLSKSDLFGGYSLDINLWLTGQILHAENRLSIQNKSQQEIQEFLNSGLFVDMHVNLIYQQAKKYADENDIK